MVIKTKIYEFREFELETMEGFTRAYLPCTCSATWTVVYDPNFGADLDGNRGESRWTIEDVTLDNIEIDGDPVREASEKLLNKIIVALDGPKGYPE
jgi:hypothetical protein